MFTFLPRTYRIQVEREYRKRLLTVVSVLFLILSLTGAALAAPSYLTMSAKKNAVVLSLSGASVPAPETLDLESRVKDVQAKAVLLQGTFGQKSLASVLEQVALRAAQPGISITGLGFKRAGVGASQGGLGAVSLSGIARTRDDLVTFSKALNADPTFRNVSLPVSALAKSRDIPFSLSVNSQF